LKIYAHDKNIFKENERAFEDLDKNDVIKPNIAHNFEDLQICQSGLEALSRSFGGP
jgi:hypothetical protein